MSEPIKILPAVFFRSASGVEPVREWLRELDKNDRTIIGGDIKTVEFGWPIGMPTCRAITGRRGLWEVRSHLTQNRIARVLFCIRNNKMVLLHGFVKKTQQTPKSDLDLAMRRKKEHEDHDSESA